MPRKKITTTIYITEDQNEKLKSLHQQTKVPVAEYIRQGIDLILKRHQAELPGEQLSLLNSFGESGVLQDQVAHRVIRNRTS